jgi:heterodisulfide reductase subunit A-like polyferredoxin
VGAQARLRHKVLPAQLRGFGLRDDFGQVKSKKKSVKSIRSRLSIQKILEVK